MGRDDRDDEGGWNWHYSAWTGIMYGPIPVGIILLVVAAVVYFAFFHNK